MFERPAIVALFVVICGKAAALGAPGSQQTEVLGSAHAKGIVVLRASLPDHGPLHSFALEMSEDASTFTDAQCGPVRGLRFAGAMLPQSNSKQEAVLVVPLVGRFDLAPKGFLFPSPGTYSLRWDIAFQDRALDPLKLTQTIHIHAPLPDDLEFIRRIGDAGFVKATFGVEVDPGRDEELTALGLIAEFLAHAESDPAEEGPWDVATSSADALMGLVRRLPESSYAPYAAYYSAGVYRLRLTQLPEFREVNAAARDHVLYQKGSESLGFVIEHGDEFLKPRASCCLAQLHLGAEEFDKAETAVQKAVEHFGKQGVTQDVTSRIRDDIRRTRSEVLKRAPIPRR